MVVIICSDSIQLTAVQGLAQEHPAPSSRTNIRTQVFIILGSTATHNPDLPPNRKCHQLTVTYIEIKLAA